MGMSRQQAIKIISQMIKDEEGFLSDNTVEAHKMAIKALEQEPTTKNDLGVVSGLEKNSKKLEKDFGELDCISRAQTQTEIEMNASRYTIAKERGGMGQVEWSNQLIKVSDAVDIIRHLPSVTPQERTGHWVGHWIPTYGNVECSVCGSVKDSRNVGKATHYCDFCGAKMESEDKE